MEFIVQPVIENSANMPVYPANSTKRYVIACLKSRLVLGTSDGNLVQDRWGERHSQMWRIERITDQAGYYRIVNDMTEKCIGVANRETVGGSVVLQEADGALPLTQRWALVTSGASVYRIKTAGWDNVVSLREGASSFELQARRAPANDSIEEAKKFQEQEFAIMEIQDNVLAQNYGAAITIYEGTGYGGAHRDVALGKYHNGRPGQRFWRLRNLKSENCLGAGGSTTNMKTTLWMKTGQPWRQMFQIEPDPSNSRYFRIYVNNDGGPRQIIGTDSRSEGAVVKRYDTTTSATRNVVWEIKPLQGCFHVVIAGSDLAMMDSGDSGDEGTVMVRTVTVDSGDDYRWVLQDESWWQVDTSKRYKLRSAGHTEWLDSNSSGWDPVIQSVGGLTDKQLWHFRPAGGPDGKWRQHYRIESVDKPGKVITVNGSPTTDATRLKTAADGAEAEDRQTWWVVRLDDGRFMLRAGNGSHNLDSGGNDEIPIIYHDLQNDNQRWSLVEEENSYVYEEKRYVIAGRGGMVLTEENGQAVQRPQDNRPEQIWKVIPTGSINCFYVENAATHHRLVATDTENGRVVTVKTADVSSNMVVWNFAYATSKKFTLANSSFGRLLDAADGKDGTKPIVWDRNGGVQQNWHFLEVADGRQISTSSLSSLDFSPWMIRSIKVPRGLRVTLYAEPYLGGNTLVLTADSPDIGDFDAVSILVEPLVTLTTSAGDKALGIGAYTTAALTALGIDPATITAVRVPQGMQVALFDADTYSGHQRVLSSDVASLADIEFAGATRSITVKAAGVTIPAETLRFGDVISLRSQRPNGGYFLRAHDEYNALRDDGDPSGGDHKFEVVRKGPSRFKDLVCYGDSIALKSVKYPNNYVRMYGSNEAWQSSEVTSDETELAFVRAGAGTSRSFVSRGDVVAIRSKKYSRYLSGDHTPGPKYSRKTKEEIQEWEGWKIDHVWPVAREDDTPPPCTSDGAPVCTTFVSCASRSITMPPYRSYSGTTTEGAETVVSPLRLTKAQIDARDLPEFPCPADLCGTAACTIDGGILSLCGAAATGIGFCAIDLAGVGVCGAAFTVWGLCGTDMSIVAMCGAAASGIGFCGADFCGAAACGTAVCGGAACGVAGCGVDIGNGGCGAEACMGNVSALLQTCPADACAFNACVINACIADACAADACVVDVIPIIPGI